MNQHQRVLWAAVLAVTPFVSHAQGRESGMQHSVVNGVSVRVAPLTEETSAKVWTFALSVEAPGRAVADEPMKAATLVTSDGRQMQPRAWKPQKGKTPQGHRAGKLEFPAPQPQPNAVELRYQRPGEDKPRSFRWTFR